VEQLRNRILRKCGHKEICERIISLTRHRFGVSVSTARNDFIVGSVSANPPAISRFRVPITPCLPCLKDRLDSPTTAARENGRSCSPLRCGLMVRSTRGSGSATVALSYAGNRWIIQTGSKRPLSKCVFIYFYLSGVLLDPAQTPTRTNNNLSVHRVFCQLDKMRTL
jgi:hypothetical protein